MNYAKMDIALQNLATVNSNIKKKVYLKKTSELVTENQTNFRPEQIRKHFSLADSVFNQDTLPKTVLGITSKHSQKCIQMQIIFQFNMFPNLVSLLVGALSPVNHKRIISGLKTNFILSSSYSFHKSLSHKSLFLKPQLKLYP